MMLLKSKRTEPQVEFCDRCGTVCDATCRASRMRGRALDRALAARFGLS